MLARIVRLAALVLVLLCTGHSMVEAQDECNCREVCRNSRDPQCVSECRRACDAPDSSPSCRKICADQCGRMSCMRDCIADCSHNTCPPGLDYCFSARKCVNLSNDRENCGKCDNTCTASQNCCASGGTGHCVENSTSSCGPDCNICGSGGDCCVAAGPGGRACLSLSSNTSCGKCERNCSSLGLSCCPICSNPDSDP